MKTLILILSLVYLVYVVHCANLEPRFVKDKFQQFKRSFGRRYSNRLEENLRKQIFKQKLQEVEDHNDKYKQGLETYEVEVNEFSDLTDDEFQQYVTGVEIPKIHAEDALFNVSSSQRSLRASVPDSFDWRSSGAVTAVKNQGSCGSCWAFAAVGAIESHYKIKYGTLLTLSEQQVVDCVSGKSCEGGWMNTAFSYIASNGGLNYDSHYPYEARDGVCRYNSGNPHPTILGYAYLTGVDENLLRETVANSGPVAVAIQVSGNFGSYKSGVYYNANCGTSINHAVVVVGYGTDNGQDYWLVKNSWGGAWGQGGYIKMARNRGNNCQIASYPSWPVL